ncbi:MAG TPA: glycosyl hydrolase [Bryobacteraceae bacterium]|nr:glycosyl hydrolase [Bryobacteraceae bacterium]
MRSKTAHSHPTRRQMFQAAGVLLASAGMAPGQSSEHAEFRAMPNSSRMRMHWYVFGPAWTALESDRQLRLMAEAQIGGVLIFPTYPIALDDPAHGIKNEEYLSPQFLSVLRSVTESCRRRGLTADIVLGTGWPYGGPSVTLEESAHTLRIATATSFAPKEGERVISLARIRSGEIVFYSSPTRMQVKRAALGGEGLIVDHYDSKSLEHFLKAVGDRLVDSVPAGGIRSIFCDSFEVYNATWTAKLPDAFLKRRGYDLIPMLAALFDPSHPESRDVQHDFWRTLTEQTEEEFVRPLTGWAHGKGLTTQIEAYGTPPVSLAAYRHIDVPTGEHYEWKEFSSSRWASSGAHLAGKPVILAEAWTWLGLPNRFADTLEQLKLCSDLHFLSGINALYGVTYAYSPVELGAPGWVPYFGPSTNHTAPFWPYFSHLADYVNRASYFLQRGKPVADVAVYLPTEDAMSEAGTERFLPNWAVRDKLSSNGAPPEFRLKNALHYESDVVKGIITSGYSFDGIDTFTLNSGMRVDDGRLRLGDGDYSVVVLPNLVGIDPESIEKLEQFVESGGVLIATQRLPERAWGFLDRDSRTARVRAAAERLFGPRPSAYRELGIGKGVAVFAPDEQGSFLKALRLRQPAVRWRVASEHVACVQRRLGDRDYFFIANTSEQPVSLEGTFRVGHKAPEFWNPMDGSASPGVVFEHVAEGTTVPVELGPRGSAALVFAPGTREPLASRTNLRLTASGAKVFEDGTYFVVREGRRREIAVSGIPAAERLEIRWRLTCGEHKTPLEALQSWTEIPAIRFFSGRGVYEGEFEYAAREGVGVELDLGEVHETADVRINGKPAEVLWMRPYSVDIAGLLRPGRNTIQVDVTNLLINKVLGDGPIDYSGVFSKFGRRFPAGDEWDVIREPLRSGLLGPVRLRWYKTVLP